MKEYFTVKEVSEILGLKEITVRGYISDGTIESEKVLNSRAIPRHELIRQIQKRGVEISVRDLERI